MHQADGFLQGHLERWQMTIQAIMRAISAGIS
jgi:hypothetical protein